ncbi:MAG: 4'-phosphopantetheinyl transferase family protein [Ignavibacteriales bacterium]
MYDQNVKTGAVSADTVEIYAMNIKRIRGIRQYLEYVSDTKHLEILSFRDRRDAKGTLFAELLVRALACERLGILNSQVELIRGSYGKPALASGEGFEFNLSHAGDWVVCVIDDAPVGIDVQRIEKTDMDIARFYFSREEYRNLMDKPDADKTNYFYDLWTLKESFVKFTGKGFSQEFRDFRIMLDEVEGLKACADGVLQPACFKLYDLDSEYKLAVCSSKSNFPEHIEIKMTDWIAKILHS